MSKPLPLKQLARRTLLATILASAVSPAGAYSLIDAYQDALGNDAELAGAIASLEADKQLLPLARSETLPNIGASAEVSREHLNPDPGPTSNYTSQLYGVQLSYPLYDPVSRVAVDQSQLQIQISEAALASARQDLMLRVAEAYFNVLAAVNTYTTTQAEKTAIGEQLAAAKRNFEVGTATITDQQEAQARYDLAVADEVAAQNQLEVQRAALKLLTGQPVPERLDDLPGEVVLAGPEPADESAWSNQARQDNLLVRQATLNAEIARREIDRQRYASRPTVSVVGQLAHARNPSGSSVGVRSNSASAGLQLAIPLYTGGAIQAGVRQATASLDSVQANVEVVRRQAEQGARESYLGLISGLGQVNALKAAEKSSQLALDSNRLGYDVGVRINIDVLNAQQQLYSTQRDLARARYDVLVNGLRLKSTTATLDEQDLQQLSGLLAPVRETKPDAPAPKPARKRR